LYVAEQRQRAPCAAGGMCDAYECRRWGGANSQGVGGGRRQWKCHGRRVQAKRVRSACSPFSLRPLPCPLLSLRYYARWRDSGGAREIRLLFYAFRLLQRRVARCLSLLLLRGENMRCFGCRHAKPWQHAASARERHRVRVLMMMSAAAAQVTRFLSVRMPRCRRVR